ncbi:MAG: presenilin family intramembrane aspartyl protease [Candidatus Bathyarchaeota archaeon]|nr:presenilin family intramembrane aspartyl protease [Candidatus Bathyarchaeota archaeon]
MTSKIKTIDVLPMVVMGSLFVLINCLALLVSGPFKEAGAVAFIDATNPLNLVEFFLILAVFTAAILLIAKYWKKDVIQWIILVATAILCFYVFFLLLNIILAESWALGLSLVAAAVLLGLLARFPEWYIIDATGIITSVGAIAMLGISLSVLLVIILLVCMAVYDAISVYKTKHMIDLADTLIDLKLPILFVIPKTRHYSLLDDKKSLKQKLSEGEKREAFFLGTGDVVIPGILAAASYHSTPNGLGVALSVVAGTLAGFAVLMTFVLKGKPQAGLPFLCPGAIIGYLVSSLVLTGEFAGLSLLIPAFLI